MRTRLTILIIEDEPEILASMTTCLQHAATSLDVDVELLEAGSALEAVALQRGNAVDAVFVDLSLRGGVSGIEAIWKMHDPFDRLFVVLVSGAPEAQLGEALVALQLRLKMRFEFAPKPVSYLEIKAAVMKCAEFVRGRPLPHPLAVAIQVARQGSNATLRLHALERALELILKLNVFLMASDMISRSLRVFDTGEAGFAQQLTLGPWLALAKQFAVAYSAVGDIGFAPQIPTALKASRGGALALVRAFKPIRDAEIHHGFPSDALGHEARVEEFSHRFESLVDSLSYLRDMVWAASDRVDILAGEDFRYSLLKFMGENDRFERLTLSSRDRLEDRRVYAFDARLRRLCLFPFVLWRHCPECHRGRLFLLDNFHDGNFLHKDTLNHLDIDSDANLELNRANALLAQSSE